MIPAPRLALCLLAAGLCILGAQGSLTSVRDCCVSTRDMPLSPKKLPLFQSYKIQEPYGGCYIRAIVLITRHGRGLCFPPESNTALYFQKALDERKSRRQKTLLDKSKTSSQN